MVSIIIPVYNVGPYLRECLDSVVNQTYRDWEGILIDDGSTDDSGAICDEYASKDRRFRVIHQANQGINSVRNRGLKETTGEYIAWVDSDDVVHPRWLETLHSIITTNDCDIAVVEYRNWYNGQINIDDNIKIAGARFIPLDQAIDQVLNSGIKGFTSNLWTKMYRREIIGESSLVFDWAEDLDFNIQMIIKGARIYCTETPLYFYRIRGNSITNGRDQDYLLRDIVMRCDVYDHYRSLDKDLKYRPIILESLYQHLLYAKNYPVYNNASASATDEEYYQEAYRRTWDDFKRCDGISRGMRVKMWLVRNLPQLYFLMVRLKKLIH